MNAFVYRGQEFLISELPNACVRFVRRTVERFRAGFFGAPLQFMWLTKIELFPSIVISTGDGKSGG